MDRRTAIAALVAGLAVPAFVPARRAWGEADRPNGKKPGDANAFSHDAVVARARSLAADPYKPPADTVPPALANLKYEDYRQIRFDPAKALMREDGGPFSLQLFHRGFLYKQAVVVNVVRDGVATVVPFSPDLFAYGPNKVDAKQLAGLGFAGLRLHYPLNRINVVDELASFLGASYFRVLSRDQHYGLSARGLAIDTALPSGEEFPAFREFWIESTKQGADAVIVHALLDSPSITGAYRFEIRPGAPTTIDVAATLFPRSKIKKLGIAPLTSMFLYGEQRRRRLDNFRPELHDSDGLLMHNGRDEWLWRPLANPAKLAVSSFIDQRPRGFGLMQRDRVFDHYLDLDAEYQRRPSYWIEPKGDWGAGHVELVEIPSTDDTNDNIVACWVPKAIPSKGESLTIEYRLSAFGAGDHLHPRARVIATRQMSARTPGRRTPPPNARRFLIDIAGGGIDYYLNDPKSIEPVVTASRGRIVGARARPHPAIRGFRVSFELHPEPGHAVDLRVYLRRSGKALSEIWTMPWGEGG